MGGGKCRERPSASRGTVVAQVVDQEEERIRCASGEVLLAERSHCGLEVGPEVRRRFRAFDGKEEGQLVASRRCYSAVAS